MAQMVKGNEVYSCSPTGNVCRFSKPSTTPSSHPQQSEVSCVLAPVDFKANLIVILSLQANPQPH